MNRNPARKVKRDVDGILILDKPSGISSNRALQIAKRLFNARKAGHTGSLDPLATGMLPLCFGHATKVSGLLLNSDKAYEVRLRWGARRDTADAEGEIVETSPLDSISEAALQRVLPGFLGDSEQVPPMYSALKHEGERLYKLAREGREVTRPPRPIHLFALTLSDYDPCTPKLFVHCSKGTYIRSLVEDIAAALGTLAYVTELRRVWVEPFTTLPMVTIEALEMLAANDPGDSVALDQFLTPSDSALQHLAAVTFDGAGLSRLLQGQTAVVDAAVAVPAEVRMYAEDGVFIGLGQASATPDGVLEVAPKRLFISL